VYRTQTTTRYRKTSATTAAISAFLGFFQKKTDVLQTSWGLIKPFWIGLRIKSTPFLSRQTAENIEKDF